MHSQTIWLWGRPYQSIVMSDKEFYTAAYDKTASKQKGFVCETIWLNVMKARTKHSKIVQFF